MNRRRPQPPKPKLPLWKPDGALWRADVAELARLAASVTEEQLRSRMGRGREILDRALRGEALDGYRAQFVESALEEQHFHIPKCYCPDTGTVR